MFGISSNSKEALGQTVEDIFDRIALQLLGNIPKLQNKKQLILSYQPNFGLPHLFVQGMANKAPNEIEKDVLKSMLESAYGYIESLKNKTKSDITEQLDGLAREARLGKRKISKEEVQSILNKEFKRAKSHMAAIAEQEGTKFRNLGSMMDIARVSSSLGDADPTVFFVVVRDNVLCNECRRLHLMPDGVTPRLYKLSELKQGYHKRGEDSPSAFGLHPHCFTGDAKLHTSIGLKSFKELYESQQSVEVFVDNRVKNRRIGNNQHGELIPGSVWLDRHAKGTTKKKAVPIYDTGKQECLSITLSNGMELKVSTGHEMWVDDDENGKKIRADQLKIDDKIPLVSGECGYGTDSFPELAELMGNLMGDGTIGKDTALWNFFGNDIEYGEKLFEIAKKYRSNNSNYSEKMTIKDCDEKYNVSRSTFNSTILRNIFVNEFGLSKKPRRVPGRLFSADKSTIIAFLRGLYAADGHSEKSPSIVLGQNDKEFLKEIQLLLSNIGLISSLHKHGEECYKKITYANRDVFTTKRKACWRLAISGWEQCAIFAKEIGMGVATKQSVLLKRLQETEGKCKHGSWRTAKVISIEKIGIQQTYCTTEPMTNTLTVNGIVTGNCRCTLTYLSRGFGFKEGKLKYQEEGFDAYQEQRA